MKRVESYSGRGGSTRRLHQKEINVTNKLKGMDSEKITEEDPLCTGGW